jgi:hypothetical protein
MKHPKISISSWTLTIVLAVITASPAWAATFRITSKIYQGKGLDPSFETWILFDEGLVYELPQTDSRTVTVYDPAQGRVTLLDRQQKVQTSVTAQQLLDVSAQARAQTAAMTPEQQRQLGLTATVEPSKRVIGFAVQFGNQEYHATTQKPTDPSIALDYGRFADLSSRLNIMRRLGPAPFARMALYDAIARAGEVPMETTLSVTRKDKVDEYRSQHELLELTNQDRQKIDEVQGMLTLYKEVALTEFPAPH